MDRQTDAPMTRAAADWDTDAVPEIELPLEMPDDDALVIRIPLRSNLASMLFVELSLVSGKAGVRYTTSIVIEWQGWEPVSLRIGDFKSLTVENLNILDFDKPKGPCSARLLRDGPVKLVLRAKEATLPGTILDVGRPEWLRRLPLVPIHDGEAILENLTSSRYWVTEDWKVSSDAGMPVQERGIEKIWFFLQMWYIEKAGRDSTVCIRRDFDQDIEEYQAMILSVSFDRSARLSATVVIDGAVQPALRNVECADTAMELRIPIRGRRLQSLELELRTDASRCTDAAGVRKVAFLRWVLLEKRGFDHRRANLVTGMPRIDDPERLEEFDTCALPIGILFGREDVPDLRRKTKTGSGRTLFQDIRREVEASMALVPEDHVGFFIPVDMWNQGIDRDNSHKVSDRLNSLMVNGGLAYALTGELRYGLHARRALLASMSCTHWCGGFVSRFPRGLPGYRAPFIEAHTAEAAALCYDMIYNLLSPVERSVVEEAMFTKAIPWLDAYLRQNGEGDGYLLRSNQGPVYSAGFVMAALVAMRSHPEVRQLLKKRTAWLLRMIRGYYNPEGSTLEGPSYWQYTTHYTILPLIAISRLEGRDVKELAPGWFENTVEYMLHMRSLADTKLRFQSIADCPESLDTSLSGASFLFFARYYGNAGASWIWRNYLDHSHGPGDSFFCSRVSGNYSTVAILTLVLMDDREAEPPRLPPLKLFEGCQRIFVRTGSDFGDTVLVFEGGRQTFEHSHWDKGQFLIEACGERLLCDPGIIQYGNPNAVLFKTTPYHNLLTVGRRNQSYKDPERAVVIEKVEDAGPYTYIRADLSNSYKELDVYERSILFVRPDYFVVVDVVSSTEGALDWNLISKGVFLKETGGSYTILAPAAGMRMAVASDVELTDSYSTFSDEEGPVAYHLALSPGTEVRRFVIASVLCPFRRAHGMTVPWVRVEEKAADTILFRAHAGGSSDSVRCVLRPEAGGLGSTAAIEVVRERGGAGILRFRVGPGAAGG